MAKKRDIVLLAGATGLVGGEVLRALLLNKRWNGRVIAPVRRPLALTDARLSVLVTDFSDGSADTRLLPTLQTLLAGEPITSFICCLGTTIKMAGSREAFIAID